jgi:hypothetical protein
MGTSSSPNDPVRIVRRSSRGRDTVIIIIRRCRGWIVKPVIAYLIVTLALALAFGYLSSRTHEHLKQNDYAACVRERTHTHDLNLRLPELRKNPLPLPKCENLNPNK